MSEKKGFFEKIGLVKSLDEGGEIEANLNTNVNINEVENQLIETQPIYEKDEITNVISVDDIYKKANETEENKLNDLNTSIFKIEEFKNALPKELPTVDKKNSILGILNVSKIELNDLLKDGDKRVNILQNFLNQYGTIMKDEISVNEQKIMELENQIKELQVQIINNKTYIEKETELITNEVNKINDIKKFIN
jgi:hypothetical protein